MPQITKANKTGSNAERVVEKLFADHGWFTFLPFGQDPPIDLIAVRGNDIRTIQVRAVTSLVNTRTKSGRHFVPVGKLVVTPKN